MPWLKKAEEDQTVRWEAMTPDERRRHEEYQPNQDEKKARREAKKAERIRVDNERYEQLVAALKRYRNHNY